MGSWLGKWVSPGSPHAATQAFFQAAYQLGPSWEGRGVYRRTGVQSHCLLPPTGAPTLPVFSQWKGIRRKEGEGLSPEAVAPRLLCFCSLIAQPSQAFLRQRSTHLPHPSLPSSQHLAAGRVGGGAGRGLSPTSAHVCVLSHISCV